MKEVQVLYTCNYKTSLKEIKDDLNKKEYPFCASPGLPTPVPTCWFHFCTDSDEEFSPLLRCPQRTPNSLVGLTD